MTTPSFNASRRALLAASATGVAATALSAPLAAQTAGCGGLSRAQFEEYIGMFNANQPGFIKYYHPDVVLELGATEIKTPQGILDFYAEVKAHLKETVQIEHFISDATGLAVMLPTEFACFKEWDSKFFNRVIKQGEVLRTISFVLYWVENGQFKHIRSARYKTIHEWKMEGA